ncbi:MAG: ARPP-1 family domain-containing protein [Planctomycetota bacterium]|jgi:hypothetical protein
MRNTILAGAITGLLALGGCSSRESPRDIVRLDEHHTLGEAVTVRNLTVWPVFTDRPLEVGEFLTLQEALQRGVAEVRERGAGPEGPVRIESERVLQTASAATVNTLVIDNQSELPILVCAGTVVTGGKQDRQIGQDFVVQARATVPVDAFCVEQGRWTTSRGGLDTRGRFEVASSNAATHARASGQYLKDQGKVWQEVAQTKADALERLSDPALAQPGAITVQFSATTSLAVVQDASSRAAAPTLAKYVEAVRRHFAAHADCVGFAYAINGRPVNVRSFAHPRIFGQQFEPFLRTMATEAMLAGEEQARAARAEDVVALVRGVADAEETVSRTTGLNRNGVKETAAAFHSSCYIQREGKRVSLTRDWTAR